MKTSYKHCQSCGMPLRRDRRGGGSNADGTRSRTYCSRCLVGGRFLNPTLTVEQMQVLVEEKLRERGFPGFLGWIFTSRIPKLERWSGKRAG
jgi:hypothetical protein